MILSKSVSCSPGKLVQVTEGEESLCSVNRNVSLASEEFSCQNITHQSIRASEGENLTGIGVTIQQTLRGMGLEYCILAKKEVRSHLRLMRSIDQNHRRSL